jgi:hypothetical protein
VVIIIITTLSAIILFTITNNDEQTDIQQTLILMLLSIYLHPTYCIASSPASPNTCTYTPALTDVADAASYFLW